MSIPRNRLAVIAAASATTLALGLATATAAPGPNPNSTKKFRAAVSVPKIHRHLEALQGIADRYGDRAAGTDGYAASARYVEHVLTHAGYKTRRQSFPFLYFELVSPEVLRENSPNARDIDTHVMTNSPSTPAGGVTADVVAPTNPIGCTPEDWAGADATGKIALVSRGTCSFLVKSQQAAAAGAVAVVVSNNAVGELNGTLGDDPSGAIPSAGITQADGDLLRSELAAGPVNLTLELLTLTERRETFNVLTQTRRGSRDSTIMLGAHLDSVHEGPGINDNGSGTATLLTTARELAKVKGIKHQVRFSFWGAEEPGLVGSTYYVNDLVANDPETLGSIATYLNFDMIGSPNYIVAVYDADESTYEATAEIPPGSVETEDVFTNYFDNVGQDWIDYAFSGRSDYQAFINNGVAAGGLSSGSDGIKTPEQQALFGGTAGLSYDPNYHSPEDDLDNVDLGVLDIMSNAVAHATLVLARNTSLVEPDTAATQTLRTTRAAPAAGTVRR